MSILTPIDTLPIPENGATVMPPRRFLERGLVRFSATLVTTLVGYSCSFFTGIIVARTLGSANYGDLSFLLGTFVAMNPLLEMGTSSAFYTFLAQKRRGLTFFLMYTGWMAFQFLTPLILIGLIFPQQLIQHIWVGQQRNTVLLAFAASFFVNQFWIMINQMGEARRKTVHVQIPFALQSVLHLVLISSLVILKVLSVKAVMGLLLGEYILLAALTAPARFQDNFIREEDESPSQVFREFAHFCKPLMINAWAGFAYLFADRWLLQNYAGSKQQGFFAFSQQLANVTLIITVAMQNVFWKEIAEAREQKNHQRVERLYTLVSRTLYCVAAWISCLLVVHSREILAWTVGAKYQGAEICLAWMFLYSIHQVLGSVNGTIFFSTGDTMTHFKIGLLLSVLSIPATYFVLAPTHANIPGLGWGATGLAVKMVIIQFFGANLQAWVLARRHGWSYQLSYQLISVAFFLGLGWSLKWFSSQAFVWTGPVVQPMISAVVTSLLYAAATIAVIWRLPQLVGLTAEDLVRLRLDVMQLFKPLKVTNA